MQVVSDDVIEPLSQTRVISSALGSAASQRTLKAAVWAEPNSGSLLGQWVDRLLHSDGHLGWMGGCGYRRDDPGTQSHRLTRKPRKWLAEPTSHRAVMAIR